MRENNWIHYTRARRNENWLKYTFRSRLQKLNWFVVCLVCCRVKSNRKSSHSSWAKTKANKQKYIENNNNNTKTCRYTTTLTTNKLSMYVHPYICTYIHTYIIKQAGSQSSSQPSQLVLRLQSKISHLFSTNPKCYCLVPTG